MNYFIASRLAGVITTVPAHRSIDGSTQTYVWATSPSGRKARFWTQKAAEWWLYCIDSVAESRLRR